MQVLPTTWGELIRSKRAATGMTQVQLADALDASQATISGWERGARPSAAQQRRLIPLLDITPDELHAAVLGGEAA